MGMSSFEEDPTCKRAVKAVRLLLKPSFHPEVCLTFADGNVSVVCARTMIWRQFKPLPVLTDRAEGTIALSRFADLLSLVGPIARPGAVPGIMIDGMPLDLLHFQDGSVALKAGGNASRKGDFSTFVAQAIATAWECISNPYCRNSLADAAEYVGKSFPREVAPPRKPTIETMVLGPQDDREQLLEALRKHRDG